MRIAPIIFFLLFSSFCFGQSDSIFKEYYSKAKEKIAENDYKAAHGYFKKIFSLKTTFPDDLAYYYGLTLVKLEYYKKGKEALEKYQELKGLKGEFYRESGALIAEADKHICQKCHNSGFAEVTDTCVSCHGVGKKTVQCASCNSQGIEFCQSCHGQGTKVIRGSLGNNYSTCRNCSGKGYVTCQVCQGTKSKTEYCSECKGKGLFHRKVACSH